MEVLIIRNNKKGIRYRQQEVIRTIENKLNYYNSRCKYNSFSKTNINN